MHWKGESDLKQSRLINPKNGLKIQPGLQQGTQPKTPKTQQGDAKTQQGIQENLRRKSDPTRRWLQALRFLIPAGP